MQIFNKYLVVMFFLIIVVFASGCVNNSNSTGNVSSAENNSPSQNTSHSPVNNTNNSSSTSGIVLAVSYQGTWNGTISDSSGNRTVQGTGNEKYNLGSNQTSITANFQKLGNDTLLLRVDLLNGTQIIQSETNSSPFGNVSISQNF